MALELNNTEIDGMYLNGVEIEKAYLNGVEVYKRSNVSLELFRVECNRNSSGTVGIPSINTKAMLGLFNGGGAEEVGYFIEGASMSDTANNYTTLDSSGEASSYNSYAASGIFSPYGTTARNIKLGTLYKINGSALDSSAGLGVLLAFDDGNQTLAHHEIKRNSYGSNIGSSFNVQSGDILIKVCYELFFSGGSTVPNFTNDNGYTFDYLNANSSCAFGQHGHLNIHIGFVKVESNFSWVPTMTSNSSIGCFGAFVLRPN